MWKSYQPATQVATGASSSGAPNLAYIDCLRGYAVLLVICCHSAFAFPELPYPVHRTVTFGWFGVQLFFLASCVTLMMSAHRELETRGSFSISSFFIRRFLRIAPMYYAGAALFWLIEPPENPTLSQLAASLFFVNAWHPQTMPTVPHAWEVVPGGWSIGVEFTFYMVFPVFLALVTSLKRALVGLAGAVILAAFANGLLQAPLRSAFGETAMDNFLHFWFLNQAPVFFLGAVVFFLMRKIKDEPGSLLASVFTRHSHLCAAGALVALAILAAAKLPFSHFVLPTLAAPKFLAASLGFAVLMLALPQMRRTILVNPLAANLGKVSFSAYVLHIAVIELVLRSNARLFHLEATSWAAIAAYFIGTAAVVVATFAAASVTYRLIEEPFMSLAKRLAAPRLRVAAPPASR